MALRVPPLPAAPTACDTGTSPGSLGPSPSRCPDTRCSALLFLRAADRPPSAEHHWAGNHAMSVFGQDWRSCMMPPRRCWCPHRWCRGGAAAGERSGSRSDLGERVTSVFCLLKIVRSECPASLLTVAVTCVTPEPRLFLCHVGTPPDKVARTAVETKNSGWFRNHCCEQAIGGTLC